MNSLGDGFASSRHEVSFHPLEGGSVLFDAQHQRLYALNPVASFVWLCLRDDPPKSEATRALADAFGVEMSVAVEWIRTSMESFQNDGLLEAAELASSISDESSSSKSEPKPPGKLIKGERTRTGIKYYLFDQSFLVSAPDHLQPEIDSLIGGLRIADSNGRPCSSGLEIEILSADGGWDIVVNGKVDARCQKEAVVAELERLIIQTIVPATPHLLTLHAATTRRGDRTYLLAGDSGEGKTTLSVALVRSGWSFGSDEIALLGYDMRLRPLPLPACIKVDTFPLIETWFPALRGIQEHRRYDKIVKYLALKSSSLAGGAGYVIFPHYRSEGSNEIRLLDGLAGLQRLLANCIFIPSGFKSEDVAKLLQWHHDQRYFDLFFNDADAAVDLLAGLRQSPTD